MIPTDFEGTNVILGKPEGMTDEQCYSIKGKRGIDENNFPYTMVAFTPNADDMKALQEGRALFVKVLGTQFAPISLFTFDENGNGNWE